jgi:hypothetical protein
MGQTAFSPVLLQGELAEAGLALASLSSNPLLTPSPGSLLDDSWREGAPELSPGTQFPEALSQPRGRQEH